MTARAMTANRLTDGSVVYLTRDGGWSEKISDCLAADGDEDAERMKIVAERAEQSQRVIGAYLIDLSAAGDAPRPLTLREAIRAGGPSVAGAAGTSGNGAGNGAGNGKAHGVPVR